MPSETNQQLIERIERLEAQLRGQTLPGQKDAEQEWLEKIRQKSRLQGLGEPIENPNLHRFLKYPGWRYHLNGDSMVVNNPAEDAALGEGWFKDYESFVKALNGNGEPAPTAAKKAAVK